MKSKIRERHSYTHTKVREGKREEELSLRGPRDKVYLLRKEVALSTEANTALGRLESSISLKWAGLSSLFSLLCRFNKATKRCQTLCRAPGNGSQMGYIQSQTLSLHIVEEIATV